MTDLETVRKWIKRYGYTISIQNNLVYELKYGRHSTLFPLNITGLLDACSYAARMNQDIYRQLPVLSEDERY